MEADCAPSSAIKSFRHSLIFELNMTPTAVIREMRQADLPAVLGIQAACYTQVAPESKESLAAKLCASPSTCFIAALEGEAVGYLISIPWEFSAPPALNAESCQLPRTPDCLYLHDLAVAPSARKAGAGRALVQAFLSELSKSGLGRASLIAVQDSAQYWRRYGFRSVPLTEGLKAKLAGYGQGVEYMERLP
jgi:predicted N-acetyltransferase YhbS